MSGQSINQDGVTQDEIETTLSVLKTIYKSCVDGGRIDDARGVKNTRFFVKLYEEDSRWRKTVPSDTVTNNDYQPLTSFVPEEGDGQT